MRDERYRKGLRTLQTFSMGSYKAMVVPMKSVTVDEINRIAARSQQAREALDIANQTRRELKEARIELSTGVLSIEDAVLDSRLAAMPVWRLLNSLPNFGPQRSSRAMIYLGVIRPTTCVRDLSHRQILKLSRVDKEVRSG